MLSLFILGRDQSSSLLDSNFKALTRPFRWKFFRFFFTFLQTPHKWNQIKPKIFVTSSYKAKHKSTAIMIGLNIYAALTSRIVASSIRIMSRLLVLGNASAYSASAGNFWETFSNVSLTIEGIGSAALDINMWCPCVNPALIVLPIRVHWTKTSSWGFLYEWRTLLCFFTDSKTSIKTQHFNS